MRDISVSPKQAEFGRVRPSSDFIGKHRVCKCIRDVMRDLLKQSFEEILIRRRRRGSLLERTPVGWFEVDRVRARQSLLHLADCEEVGKSNDDQYRS